MGSREVFLGQNASTADEEKYSAELQARLLGLAPESPRLQSRPSRDTAHAVLQRPSPCLYGFTRDCCLSRFQFQPRPIANTHYFFLSYSGEEEHAPDLRVARNHRRRRQLSGLRAARRGDGPAKGKTPRWALGSRAPVRAFLKCVLMEIFFVYSLVAPQVPSELHLYMGTGHGLGVGVPQSASYPHAPTYPLPVSLPALVSRASALSFLAPPPSAPRACRPSPPQGRACPRATSPGAPSTARSTAGRTTCGASSLCRASCQRGRHSRRRAAGNNTASASMGPGGSGVGAGMGLLLLAGSIMRRLLQQQAVGGASREARRQQGWRRAEGRTGRGW